MLREAMRHSSIRERCEICVGWSAQAVHGKKRRNKPFLQVKSIQFRGRDNAQKVSNGLLLLRVSWSGHLSCLGGKHRYGDHESKRDEYVT